MDIIVSLSNNMFRDKGNYFIVVQLDEVVFPERTKKSAKYRTEVIPLSTMPKFLRNLFTFHNTSLGNRLTLKIGLFDSKLTYEDAETEVLLANSVLAGSHTMIFTQEKIVILREKPSLEKGIVLKNQEQEEIGRLTLTLKFKPSTFEQQVDEDVRYIDKLYYDPYENDEEIISKKLKKVSGLLDGKQDNLKEAMKKLDFVRSMHQSVTRELAQLKIMKEKLEIDNAECKKDLEKYTSLKELNIQIDLLKDTYAGRALLKERYAKLLNKLNLERQVYEDLSREYFKIEDKLKEKKQVERQIEEVKQASSEQKFHIQRVNDMYPQLKNLKESIKQQEDIIQNLQIIVKETLKNEDLMRDKEVVVNLEKLKYDQKVLTEKHKQLKIVLDVNEGSIPLHVFERLQKDEYIMDDPWEVAKYKKRADDLLKEVEAASHGLYEAAERDEDNKKKYEEWNDPKVQFERDIMLHQIQALENKAETLEQEATFTVRGNAKELSNLQQKLITLDSLLIGLQYR